MVKQFFLFLVPLIFCFFSCSEKPTLEELKKYAATEKYPADLFLDTVKNKRALVILAHDDDDCAMSGTIARLHKAGWKIEQWTLGNTDLAEGRTSHPAAITCDGNHLILADGQFRNKLADDTLPRYMPVKKEKFATLFATEKVSAVLVEKINAFDPSVIFSLDNEIGGYGNPEHVFISQLLVDLFHVDSIHPQKIYQAVYTDHMEKTIIEERLTKLLKKWGFENTYLAAEKVYGVDGMPEPTVEINITATATEKMNYLRAYHEDAGKNLRKFIPYYDDFDAATYFGVFDREFFRVVAK